jgi:hypothetical protein
MLAIIAIAASAAGTVVPWVLGQAEEIEAKEEQAIKSLSRAMAGKAASNMAGKDEPVDMEKYVLLPPDPSFGGRPVLVTHEEFVWWVTEGVQSPEEGIRKIRKILRAQPARRLEEECGAR